MKPRRSRRGLAAAIALGLGMALMSLPSRTPLASPDAAPHIGAQGPHAPPVNASWQVILLGVRW